MVRVLGIDPGSRVTGYGIVEEVSGKLKSISFGVIYLTSAESFPARLKKLYSELEKLVLEYHPEEVAMESIFFSKNANSALKLGQARGSAMTLFANQNLKVYEYSPTQVKQAVIGYGRSDKVQIQKMVGLMLGIQGQKELDASDALAVAICHLNSVRLQNNIEKQYDRTNSR